MDPEKKSAVVGNVIFVAMILLLAAILGFSYQWDKGAKTKPKPSGPRFYTLEPYSSAMFAPDDPSYECFANYGTGMAEVSPGTRIMILEDPGEEKGEHRTIKFKVDEGLHTGWVGLASRSQILPQ